jgi:hypothetical protein
MRIIIGTGTNVKRLVLTILGKGYLGHMLNHIHEIRSIRKMLPRIMHNPTKLIPNKIEGAKWPIPLGAKWFKRLTA